MIYLAVLNIIRFCYNKRIFYSYRPKVKIISVGNITLGGTGKTPLTEWITKLSLRNNKKVGVVIRGYKKPRGAGPAGNKYFISGDEATMLEENIGGAPIYVGRDRIASSRCLEEGGFEAGILDDGFQHWRLRRDLDIVTIDTTVDLFDQYLLPLGRLREPIESLKRADIFVLTKTDMGFREEEYFRGRLNRINPRAFIVASVYRPVCYSNIKTKEHLGLDSGLIRKKRVFILAGIANPLYFDKLVSGLGIKIIKEFIYPDHHRYAISDAESISRLAKEQSVDTIVTTQKDAVRLHHILDLFNGVDIYSLKIELVIKDNETEFCNRLLSVFNS